MSKYRQFIFDEYRFDPTARTLQLHYAFDDALHFTETYTFDFHLGNYDAAALERAIQLLFFIAGVSYYKAYPGAEITIRKGEIDDVSAGFLSRTYQHGLGEFFYVNRLDPHAEIAFPVNSAALSRLTTDGEGILIGLGGGKDSLVSAELLRSQQKVATWSLNHRSQFEPLVQTVGLPHYYVAREWDQQLAVLNRQDALNGHVPISAIFAAVGAVVAILAGYRDCVVSNESSASEPTLHYQGLDINHQYSKSLDFEKDFQSLVQHDFGSSLRYYSFLRPFSELRIAELFAQTGFEKYRGVFSSCNRAYTHDQHHMFWCGQCPKCAFVFLVLTPFIGRDELESLWGKNLLLDPALEATYRQLLGIAGDKPFDCVGEVKESRAAMRLAQQQYPELDKYAFELPAEYDFRTWREHAMPPEIFSLLQAKLR